jgi:hypothetical protein
MRCARGVLFVAAAFLCGCAWVLPKPAAPTPAAAASGSDCSLGLTESRRTRGATLYAGAPAAPLVVARDDLPSADRAIRSGAPIVLRPATVTEGAGSGASDGVALTIEAVAAAAGAADTIVDGSVVRLRGRTSGAAGTVATTTETPPRSGAEYVIYKADRPDPNRTSTCDAILRDGDFAFLRAANENAWIAVRDGKLVAAAALSPDRAPCSAPREHCYTDRYGGLLCVNYLACADERER